MLLEEGGVRGYPTTHTHQVVARCRQSTDGEEKRSGCRRPAGHVSEAWHPDIRSGSTQASQLATTLREPKGDRSRWELVPNVRVTANLGEKPLFQDQKSPSLLFL